MWEALLAPARLIAENAGLEGSVMVNRIEAESGTIGLNAATGEITDLVKAGITDPAKVTRAALQNAASIVALVLTTECLVADKPEPPSAGAGRRRHGRHGWHARNDVIETRDEHGITARAERLHESPPTTPGPHGPGVVSFPGRRRRVVPMT